jgi:hypothetical protein
MDVFRDRAGPLSGAELQLAFTFAELTIEVLLDRQDGEHAGGDSVARYTC